MFYSSFAEGWRIHHREALALSSIFFSVARCLKLSASASTSIPKRIMHDHSISGPPTQNPEAPTK
mgnify:CR=1 FL=1